MGLRLGEHPKTFISTTPQPFELLNKIMEAETTRVSRSSTFANAKNLATPFLEELKRNYLGTRLGRQELEGEILSDTPGALWKRSQLDEIRVFSIPKCKKIVVAIDPAVTAGENSDETGLIVAGLKDDNTYIVLADYSGKYEPNAWATIAIKAWEVWKADLIVAEVNNGGDMVGSIIYNINNKPAYKKVTASRGKRTRAEPIAMLYEQKKVFHYCENDNFQELVDQMCSWNPSLEREQKSPDRVDALVWALTELSEGSFTAPIGQKFDDFIKSMPKSRF
jgi:phage terminase large subunit-like protein